jgi:hypothetical protein
MNNLRELRRQRQLRRQLRTALKALVPSRDTTADDVALKLNELGFYGERASVYTCPLAEYVREELDDISVSVRVDVRVLEPSATGQLLNAREPLQKWPALKRFVQNFDNGRYPYLDRECE